MFSFLFCQNDGYELGSGTSSSQGINVVPDMNYKMKLPDSIMRLKWGGGGVGHICRACFYDEINVLIGLDFALL